MTYDYKRLQFSIANPNSNLRKIDLVASFSLWQVDICLSDVFTYQIQPNTQLTTTFTFLFCTGVWFWQLHAFKSLTQNADIQSEFSCRVHGLKGDYGSQQCPKRVKRVQIQIAKANGSKSVFQLVSMHFDNQYRWRSSSLWWACYRRIDYLAKLTDGLENLIDLSKGALC